jgi:hypothetical protein
MEKASVFQTQNLIEEIRAIASAAEAGAEQLSADALVALHSAIGRIAALAADQLGALEVT